MEIKTIELTSRTWRRIRRRARRLRQQAKRKPESEPSKKFKERFGLGEKK